MSFRLSPSIVPLTDRKYTPCLAGRRDQKSPGTFLDAADSVPLSLVIVWRPLAVSVRPTRIAAMIREDLGHNLTTADKDRTRSDPP